MCVTHPASCLTGLRAPFESRDLFMPSLKGPHSHASFLPLLPLPRMLQAAVLWTARLHSLSCCEIVTSSVGTRKGARPQIPFETPLEPGQVTVICHFSIFLLKEVNELGRQKGKVESLAFTLVWLIPQLNLSEP